MGLRLMLCLSHKTSWRAILASLGRGAGLCGVYIFGTNGRYVVFYLYICNLVDDGGGVLRSVEPFDL